MKVVVFVFICPSSAGYGVCKSFFANFFHKLTASHLNIAFKNFFNVILSDPGKLSLGSGSKNINGEVKKYGHADIDAYYFERAKIVKV